GSAAWGGRGDGQGRPARRGEGSRAPGGGGRAPDRGSWASIGSAAHGGRGAARGQLARRGESGRAPDHGSWVSMASADRGARVAGARARRHEFRLAREVAESCDLPSSKLDAFATILNEYTKMTKPELAKGIEELEKSASGE